jgi:hypothetical protein
VVAVSFPPVHFRKFRIGGRFDRRRRAGIPVFFDRELEGADHEDAEG